MNTGFVLTVMRERGIVFDSSERIRGALFALPARAIADLSMSVSALQRGSDSSEDLDRLASLARCTREGAVQVCERASVEYDGARLYMWLLGNVEGAVTLAKAHAGDQEALGAVRAALTVQSVGELGAKAGSGHANEEGVEDAGAGVVGDFGLQGNAKGAIRQHKVFAKRGALVFELDEVNGALVDKRRHTLRIEAAKMLAGGDGRADWGSKIIFQLTRRELPLAVGVLFGFLKSASFEAHGERHEKKCELEVQPGRVFVKVVADKMVVAVPIEGGDLYQVGMLGLRALGMNDPDFPAQLVMEALRQSCKVIGGLQA